MKIVDDLNREPKDAFCGACLFLVPGLTWAGRVVDNYANHHSLRAIPVLASCLFLLGSMALFLRARQMQREAASNEKQDAQIHRDAIT